MATNAQYTSHQTTYLPTFLTLLGSSNVTVSGFFLFRVFGVVSPPFNPSMPSLNVSSNSTKSITYRRNRQVRKLYINKQNLTTLLSAFLNFCLVCLHVFVSTFLGPNDT